MTTLREAAQQALEALEYHVEQTRPIWKTSKAIVALMAALEQQEPLAGMSEMNRTIAYCAAAKLRELGYEWNGQAWAALEQEEQEEQEPVAWMTHGDNTLPLFHKTFAAALCWGACPTPLYTRPPRHDIAYESACGIINEQDKKLAELEAVNAELLEALKVMLYKTERHVLLPGATPAPESPEALARSAIAKAEGQK